MSVRRIVRDFDKNYVRQELKSLWSAFGHDRSMIVGPDNVVIAEAFLDYTHILRRPLSDTMEFMPAVAQARSLFADHRTRVPGGYSFSSIQGLDLNKIAALGFMLLDGRPALVSAIPIIPDQDKVALPDKEATLLVSVKYLDRDFFDFVNAQIRFRELQFHVGPSPEPDHPGLDIYDLEGLMMGHFTWEKLSVARPIWHTVIPIVLALSVTLGIMAFAIAWRIGKLTNSLQASEHQNRFLALHDTLSGLANRLSFNRTLAEAVNTLSLRPFALMHCDLDCFKLVNDTHGHAAGDAVIKEVAKRMQVVIGDAGLPCRIGGDEFAIIMNDVTERVGLQKIAGQLLSAIPEPIDLGNGEVAKVGISIGISIAPEDGLGPGDLQAAADEALYRAKNAGRGRMAFADHASPPPEKALDPDFKRESQKDKEQRVKRTAG
nr:diguanylate cyclase [Roseibium limicola]